MLLMESLDEQIMLTDIWRKDSKSTLSELNMDGIDVMNEVIN